MKVVVADRPDVCPVAVMVFEPPVVSATAVAPPVVQEPKVPTEAPVVHENEAVVHIEVVTVTGSPEAKPERAIDGVIVSSGNPKLLPV